MTDEVSFLPQAKLLLQSIATKGVMGYVRRCHNHVGPRHISHLGLTDAEIHELQQHAQDLLRERLTTHGYLEFLESLNP